MPELLTTEEAYDAAAKVLAEDLVCGESEHPLRMNLEELWFRFRAGTEPLEEHPGKESVLNEIEAALVRANVAVSFPPASDPDPRRPIALELGAAYEDAWQKVSEEEPEVDGTVWKPGGLGDRLGPYNIDNVRAKVPTWFNIDAGLLNERFSTLDERVDHVMSLLGTLCFGLQSGAIRDLLTPDERPDIKKLGGPVRLVVMRQLEARREGEAALGEDKAGELTERTVELCAGRGWLLTVWHEAPTDPPEGSQASQEAYAAVRDAVKDRWERHGKATTAHDLALLVMREIADGYRNVRRQLYTWLDDWDSEFQELEQESERYTLLSLRRQLTRVRRDVVAVSHGDDRSASHAWFDAQGAGDEAQQLVRVFDRTLEDLRYLSDALRTSFELLATTSAARTLHLAEEGRDKLDRLQRMFAFVSVVVLGPTVVATLLGIEKEAISGADPEIKALIVVAATLPLTWLALFLLGRSRRLQSFLIGLVRSSETRKRPGSGDRRLG